MKKLSFSKRHKVILSLVLLAVVFGGGYLFGQWQLRSQGVELSSQKTSLENSSQEAEASTVSGEDSSLRDNSRSKDLINLNTADYYELLELPDIGEKTAKKIIEFREENGGFNQLEDLVTLDLISQSVADKISGLVEVSFP